MKMIPREKFRMIAMVALLTVFLSACSTGESASPTDPPAPTPPPLPATFTAVSPTDTPAPTPTSEAIVVEYEDPEGDCLDNNNLPTACTPLGVDILTVTITEASPLTIVIELAGDGFAGLNALNSFGVIIGIDIDRDLTTGHTSFWPEFHGLGPDLEIRWNNEAGEVSTQFVTHFAPDGATSEGDASLVVWTVLDDNHLQVVISDALITSTSIGISGDLFTGDLYDHFVDGGHVTFPEGEVVLVE